MCSGSKRNILTSEEVMEGEVYSKDSIQDNQNSSVLLELSATDDINNFKHAVENEGYDVNESGLWYGRRIGSKNMSFKERTPLMVAAMFGSKEILKYIIESVDVNRASASDGATALHCAAVGGSMCLYEIIKLLIELCADVNRVDVNGKRPCDVIVWSFGFSSKMKRKTLDILANKGGVDRGEESEDGVGLERKEYPVDLSLPDIKNGIYVTDEFRMYTFKVKPCSRAYSHDWTECPFVHPGENARRRDPRKYHYSCVPCPEFRKGACPKGEVCEYAHGIFECWLHPAQYRTRLCKDETNCTRRVCFFAHKVEELRPLYASPRSCSSSGPSFDIGSLTPLALGSSFVAPSALQLSRSRLKAALNAGDMELKSEFCRQQLLDELTGLSLTSPLNWSGELGRLGVSGPPLFSPTGVHIRQNTNQQQLLSGMRGSSFVLESNNSSVSFPRLSAFSERSQSFLDRNTVNRFSEGLSLSSPAFNATACAMPSHLSDWGSPDGKVDWGVQQDELNKFRKSASFAYRSNDSNSSSTTTAKTGPNVSWVHSLVKKAPPAK